MANEGAPVGVRKCRCGAKRLAVHGCVRGRLVAAMANEGRLSGLGSAGAAQMGRERGAVKAQRATHQVNPLKVLAHYIIAYSSHLKGSSRFGGLPVP